MVAWESNPTAGFLIADLGPYIGSDWPPTSPDLDHRFPADAGEIDYYVLDPTVDDYRTMGSPSGSDWSDSYAYVRFDGSLRHGAYTDGSSSGPPSGAHVYVAWYDADYNTVPAAPSVTPESLIPSTYSALGTLGPLVTHWGPWITPPTQQWTSTPASVGIQYNYTASFTSMEDAVGAGADSVTAFGTPALFWVRGEGDSFNFQAGAVAPSPALGTYSAENGFGAPGFYNASPTLPLDAVDIEHETVWNSHTQAPDMLAAIVGDMQWTIGFEDRSAVSAPTDCTVYAWVEDPANIVAGPDTTHGETRRIAGSPTQTELLAGYAARIGDVAFPATSSMTTPITVDLPTSAFFYGLVPDRPDEAPGVYVNLAILEGAQGTDPPPPGTGFVTGRAVFFSSDTLTVTYQPPRYRFQLVGPAVDVAGWQVGSVAW